MSELKEHQFCRYDEIVHEYSGDFPKDLRLYYLKSEADVYIRKLDNRHKYKRCLDKAKRCFTKSNYHFVLARHGEDVKENNRRSILYSKWRNRWLELAEKFKEAE